MQINNRSYALSILALFLLAISFSAFAISPDPVTFTVTQVIEPETSLVCTDMTFNPFAATPTAPPARTIAASAAGGPDGTPSTCTLHNGDSVAHDYNISLSATDIKLTGPGSDIAVTLQLSGSSINVPQTSDGIFYIGGTETINANQTPGTYTTSVTVTATQV